MISRVNDKWVQTHGDYRLVMGERFLPALPQPKRPWYRLPLCLTGSCPHRQVSDEHGVWGECVKCGRVCAFVDRETLRADAEYEREQALTAQEER